MPPTDTSSDGRVTVTVLPPVSTPGAAEEIHHRIANSLQLLAAMVSIEARRMADPQALAALETTQRRIGAIAGVHRQLYQARTSTRVDLAAYLAELGAQLEDCWVDGVSDRHVRVDADTVIVSPDGATSIGIIVSELVGNASKYAYDVGQPGDVRIALRALPSGGYRLDVKDSGRGMTAGAAAQGTGLGAQLIRMMATRLDAHHAWHDALPGTHFMLLVGC